MTLDQLVGHLAGQPGLGQLEQHALRIDVAVARLEILGHPGGIDVETLGDEDGQVEHVVEQDRRVGQDHALHRRVADVTLVPQGDVLGGGERVGAQQAGQSADALAQLRVALVRHRAGALLALAERLLRLQHLGALQAAHLERDLLQRGPRDGQRRAELGVAVALDDLGRHRLHAEAEVAADLVLELRLDMGEVADRPRQLADGDRLARPAQPLEVASGLDVPDGDLEAERGGLGVHPVGAADGQGVAVAQRERAQRLSQLLLAGQQQVGGVTELKRGGGVPHVTGGETEVDEAGVGAELLLEAREQRDHLVLHAALDVEDALDVDPRGPDAGHGLGGDAAAARVGLAHRHFHPQPRLVLRRLAPDTSHGGPGVPLDHALTLKENLREGKPRRIIAHGRITASSAGLPARSEILGGGREERAEGVRRPPEGGRSPPRATEARRVDSCGPAGPGSSARGDPRRSLR